MTPNTQLAISIASALIAILAAFFGGLRWSASRQASQLAAVGMYSATNQNVLENVEILNPLSPYAPIHSKTIPFKQEALVRIFLLHRMNRFRFPANRRERRLHVLFRRQVMGDGLGEFIAGVRDRGGSAEFAWLSAKIMLEIYQNEPYFDDRFWRRYFRGYDWTLPANEQERLSDDEGDV